MQLSRFMFLLGRARRPSSRRKSSPVRDGKKFGRLWLYEYSRALPSATRKGEKENRRHFFSNNFLIYLIMMKSKPLRCITFHTLTLPLSTTCERYIYARACNFLSFSFSTRAASSPRLESFIFTIKHCYANARERARTSGHCCSGGASATVYLTVR